MNAGDLVPDLYLSIYESLNKRLGHQLQKMRGRSAAPDGESHDRFADNATPARGVTDLKSKRSLSGNSELRLRHEYYFPGPYIF